MSSLLAIKFFRPSIRTRWVERPRLVRRMAEGLAAGRPLTLVSAPAGFGKTACACAWLEQVSLPVTWLSLDPADDEPGRFFTYMIAALQKVDARLGREIESVLRSGQLPPVEVISAVLINDLLELKERFVLVLDDFQVIQNLFILEVFEMLFASLFQDGLTQPLHLVLLTREDPALPLARLRAANQVTEVRARDLRFDPQEAASFLNVIMGLSLGASDVAALEERTEGWVAGLQLAAIALSGLTDGEKQDPSRFIAALRGSHRYILGYLMEEVIDRQSGDVQQFLLQTAVLERLSGDLCDAVTGRNDSRLLLEKLFTANLFLVPLDDERRWYRYHHLFADLLSDLLHARLKSNVSELHWRASQWFSQAADEAVSADSVRAAELAGQAIEHALAAGDYPGAIDLIERHVTGMLVQWYAKRVDGWLQAIPLELRLRNPRANLAFAWLHLLRGDFNQALPYLQRLEAIFAAAAPVGEPALRAEWLALQATMLNAQGRAAESLVLAQQALNVVPEQDTSVRSLIYLGLAGAYEQVGNEAQVADAYQMIVRLGRAAGNLVSELLGVAALVRMAIYQGRLRFAFVMAREGLDQIERSGILPPIATAIYGEIGQVYYQWHQLEQAHQHFRRAAQVSELSGFPDAELYHGVILARLHQVDGDIEAAAQQLTKVMDLMQASAPAAVEEEVIYQQVWTALAQGRLSAAENVLLPYGFVFTAPLIFPELAPGQAVTPQFALLYLGAMRVLLYRAENRGEMDGLRRGIDLSTWLVNEALQRQYLPLALTALLLRSKMQVALGDAQAGLADVVRAVELGEPEGFISVFVEEGWIIENQLIALAGRRRLEPGLCNYIQQILLACASHHPKIVTKTAARVEPGMEPLTERELEVLQLIAGGLKYGEIADRLVVSLNTVRTHIKAIYGKLGVNNAAQAIEQARRRGIL